MRRTLLATLAIICVATWGAAIVMFTRSQQTMTVIIPTLMVLPSVTATALLPSTWVPTATATDVVLPTETPLVASTPTPTLAQRMLVVSASMPGVEILPTSTLLPVGMVLMPAPPNPVEPLIDATNNAPPFLGWFSFESDYPSVSYAPTWISRFIQYASRGEYHRTDAITGMATFPFEGEGLRIRYVAATNMGIFDVLVDGELIDTVDAYSDELVFPGTQVYFVGGGTHLLQIQVTGRKNERSQGTVVGLDAIQVYRGDENTLIIPPPDLTTTPSPAPQAVARIQLVAAPPTVQATATPIPPRVITASAVIAYDENGNRAVDPAEGVEDISVRVVELTTNRVVASGFTDVNGYVEFQVVMDAPVQVVVPYFGKTWAISNGNTAPAFTLLLNPGNQPGLIP